MDKVLVSAIPGVALACGIFLLVLSVIQFRIYFQKKYLRSKSLALFCFFASLFAFEHFVAQSRAFSPEFTHIYVSVSCLSICLSLVFYMKSLNFFVAVPNWLYKTYTISASVLALLAFGGIVWGAVQGHSFFFDPTNLKSTGNYFVDSYTMRFGMPSPFINIILSVTGFITIVGALFLLRIVSKSSRDIFFVIGLLFSVFAAAMENFLLPFTLAFFCPVVFLANLFEAYRMNSLSFREYMKETRSLKKTKAEEQEVEKYQNSNLTEQRIAKLANKLKDLLEGEKLYLNPNINSEDLAKKIGIPTYQLSQVVNIGLNTTFFELLSQQRIEEVKRRLQDKNLGGETIINIAYSSGFNSKSAFNTAFKKQTGVTPSVFRKNNSI